MINWATRQSTRRNTNNTADVSISVSKNRDKFQTCFYFRNNCEKRITGTEFIKAGIDEEQKRIYFIAADDKQGYKLFAKNGAITKTFKIYVEWRDFIGDYDLSFDNKENLWFVDMRKKK